MRIYLDNCCYSTAGLEVLRNGLGVVGAVRFLQQYDVGHGDYTKEKYSMPELNSEDLYSQLACIEM